MDERPIRLELYSRPGCHLCDDLRGLCERLCGEFRLQLDMVNIESDPELLSRYEQEVPVLFIDGRKAVKFRTTEAALRRMLQRRRLVRRLFGS